MASLSQITDFGSAVWNKVEKISDLVPASTLYVAEAAITTADVVRELVGSAEDILGKVIHQKAIHVLQFTRAIKMVTRPILFIRSVKSLTTALKVNAMTEAVIRFPQTVYKGTDTIKAYLFVPMVALPIVVKTTASQTALKALEILGAAATGLVAVKILLKFIPYTTKIAHTVKLGFELRKAQTIDEKFDHFTKRLEIDLDKIVEENKGLEHHTYEREWLSKAEMETICQKLVNEYGSSVNVKQFYACAYAVYKAKKGKDLELKVAVSSEGAKMLRDHVDGKTPIEDKVAVVNKLEKDMKMRVFKESMHLLTNILSALSFVAMGVLSGPLMVGVVTALWAFTAMSDLAFSANWWLKSLNGSFISSNKVSLAVVTVALVAIAGTALCFTSTPVGWVTVPILLLIWIGLLGYTYYKTERKKGRT